MLRTFVTRLAWLALALLIALGSAGIVAAMSHVPGTAARPELTWTGDAEMTAALDAATGDLETLAAEVDKLGATARVALSQVVAGDAEAARGDDRLGFAGRCGRAGAEQGARAGAGCGSAHGRGLGAQRVRRHAAAFR